MKKLVALVLLGFFAALAFAQTTFAAEDDLIDLYPYDQIGCMTTNLPCNATRVGTSNWKVEYNGYRYHVINGSARYVKDFNDANADGYISALEMTALQWNAFASLIINDTDEGVILSTANVRTDLTAVVHRIYSYFDEDGVIQKFEDHIHTYYIFNDGTAEDPDWRLATEAEKTAYDAAPAEDKPVTTRVTHIRMIRDDSDSNGYVLEPLGYLTWRNPDAAVEDNGSWFTTENPDYVQIPAGWTVLSFGTNDRGGFAKPLAFLRSLPATFSDESVDPMVAYYVHQPATFTGIAALDDDPATPGINMIIDLDGTFSLPSNISVSWLNMYDEDGKIQAKTEKLDYVLEISQDEVVIETINYTYDAVEDKYTASAPVTVIDTSLFGAGYIAQFKALTPEGDETVVTMDIAVGVLPPKFVGVQNRYVDEGVFVDIMKGITADDGYGNDITNTVVVTLPSNLNPYSPKPGVYTIQLDLTHHVHIPGVQATVNVKGTIVNFSMSTSYNQPISTATHPQLAVFDDASVFHNVVTNFGSVFVVVAADGTMKERYDRNNWEYTTSTGTVVGDANQFAAWQAALTLADGEYVLSAQGSVHSPILRAANLSYGDSVVVTLGKAEFNADIERTASYVLTVDDLTPPVILPVRDKLVVEIGQYATINEAVLGNVVVFDNYSSVATYVSNNGGLSLTTAGTYTVEVTAEDEAGNTSATTFQVQVVAPAITTDIIQDLIEGNTLSETQIQSLIDSGILNANILTQAQIQALIDAAVNAAIDDLPEDQTGTSVGATIAIALGSGLLSLGAAVFFMKKKMF